MIVSPGLGIVPINSMADIKKSVFCFSVTSSLRRMVYI